jgi:hypothetical protein
MLIDFCQCTLVGATLENKSALAELQFIVFCPHSMKIKSPTATHKNIKNPWHEAEIMDNNHLDSNHNHHNPKRAHSIHPIQNGACQRH